MKLKSTR